jgi:hypothetical protein
MQVKLNQSNAYPQLGYPYSQEGIATPSSQIETVFSNHTPETCQRHLDIPRNDQISTATPTMTAKEPTNNHQRHKQCLQPLLTAATVTATTTAVTGDTKSAVKDYIRPL